MDKRRLQKVENELQIEQEKITIEDVINSKRVNNLLLDKAEELFTLEFNLKQKAQLKYLQIKQKKGKRNVMFMDQLTHEYLWSPTPAYYVGTFFSFLYIKRKFKLNFFAIIPFMTIPITMDYISKFHIKFIFLQKENSMLAVLLKRRKNQDRLERLQITLCRRRKDMQLLSRFSDTASKSTLTNQLMKDPIYQQALTEQSISLKYCGMRLIKCLVIECLQLLIIVLYIIYSKVELLMEKSSSLQKDNMGYLMPKSSSIAYDGNSSNGDQDQQKQTKRGSKASSRLDPNEEKNRKSTLQKFSKDVFIQKLEIIDYEENDDHVEYYIQVQGRTKYLVNLNDIAENGMIDYQKVHKIQNSAENQEFQIVEYCIVKRYSELLIFSKLLQSEIKNYMKKRGFQPEDFPDFPPKKTFFNKSKNFLQKRVLKINNYFTKLFDKFPQKVPYTNAIIDLCQPFKLNVAVIGKKNSGKSSLIQGFVNVLVDYQKNKEYFQRRQVFGQEPLSQNSNSGQKQNINKLQELINQSSQQTNISTMDHNESSFQKSKSDIHQPKQTLTSVMAKQRTETRNIDIDNNIEVESQGTQRTKISRMGEERQPRGQSRDQQRVAKLVFKRKDRERSADNGDTFSIGSKPSTLKNGHGGDKKKLEQYFPLDVPFKVAKCRNSLFRLDIQEYQIEEADLRSLLTHLLSSEEKNTIIFTFSLSSPSSFKIYLKKALKELIFAFEDLNDGAKERRMIPFMILGMKRDLESKVKVSKEDVHSLMEVLKKHVNCEVLYTAAQNQDDILSALHQLFNLADDMFLHQMKNRDNFGKQK
ncbi:UNKNOWN [Stylonychia lemnae]|uniref:PX domain-containing protein n=1 Tax=Stylonychia lemnae TaxID=5949 RepID=A0A077ZQW0_STYLE|nr:UNKNOWN [Stylonychia lemnae]|eukprot:CDW71814.1 UNKNOWN [Stylonychia lemnae]